MHTAPKTVSIRNLHAAVKSALETARKKYPEIKLEPGDGNGGGGTALPLYLRYPWICGYPPVIYRGDLKNLAEFNQAFVSSLAGNPAIAALGVDGKFEPAMYVAGNTVSLALGPSNALVTE